MVEIKRINTITDFIPKREKKYIFLWCREGSFSLEIDNKLIKVIKNQVLTITSGQFYCFNNTHQAQGYLLSFTLDYICKTEKDIELIFQNSLFCHFDYNEIITINNPLDIESGLQKIESELMQQPFQYLESIHARIELLLVEVNRSKIDNGGEVWKPEALFLQFLEFVRNNFDKNYSLNNIAVMLQTTELKLNELVKLHTGKTAMNVIYGLKISEAQRVLQYENKTIKEVAFNLGFRDQYYFSKFFKNQVGVSPSEFKNSLIN